MPNPSDSVITRRVRGGIKRQLAVSNGLLQVPQIKNFAHQLVHGAPRARVLCITVEQMVDGGIRMTVDTGVDGREDQAHARSYVLKSITNQNTSATATSIVDQLTPKAAVTIRTFSSTAQQQNVALREMDIQECTEWLMALAGQSGMRSRLTFRRPNPQTAIEIGEN
jgi:hypothetical protein